MYLHPESGKTFANHSEIRGYFRAMSLPAVLTDETISELGVEWQETPISADHQIEANQ